tara:strand:+ start:377 stop:493 length:117 start_codon:yes stop_codon:yes gene_type:complete
MTPGTELCHREDVLELYRQSVAERETPAGDRLISLLAG